MVRHYEKKPKKASDDDIRKAAQDYIDGNFKSERIAADSVHISQFRLRKEIAILKGKQVVAIGSGTGTALPAYLEEELAANVRGLVRSGFPPQRLHIPRYVQNYIKEHPDDHITAFASNDDLPGQEWLENFMRRHALSLKKTVPLEKKRKNATADPFIIFGHFDLLGAEIARLGLEDSPERIFNLDETCFSHDQSKCRVVGIRAKDAPRIRAGPGRNNTTVLACVCADSTAMDPFIIHAGKYVQTSWRGKTPKCPNTMYGASENGWVTADVLLKWFNNGFLPYLESKGGTDRPALVILDGHASHNDLELLRRAKEKNVHIYRLPAKTTDVLQMLDVTCFGPLKTAWDSLVQANLSATGGTAYVATSTFASVLSDVWHAGLTKENIQNGFLKTGTFPSDSSRYDTTRLNPELVFIYNEWVADGKPHDPFGNPDLSKWEEEPGITVSDLPGTSGTQAGAARATGAAGAADPTPLRRSPRKHKSKQVPITPKASSRSLFSKPLTIQVHTPPSSAGHSPSPSPSVTVSVSRGSSLERIQIPPKPFADADLPPGQQFVLRWCIEDTTEKRMTDAVLSVRAQQASKAHVPSKNVIRGAVASKATVLTSDEMMADFEAKQEAKAEKERKAAERAEKKARQQEKGKGRPAAKKARKFREKEADSDESGSDTDDLAQKLAAADQADSDDEEAVGKVDHSELSKSVRNLNKALSDEDEEKFFAVFFDRHYYFGKAEVVEYYDPDDEVPIKVCFTFLEKKQQSGVSVWSWPTRPDKETIVVASHRIFLGPVVPKIVAEKPLTYRFAEEKRAARSFQLLKKFGLPDSE